MKGLIETAKKERSYEDTKAEFQALEKKLTINVEADLKKFRKEVCSVLSDEIVTRYYYQKGAVIASFREDTDLDNAKLVLAKNKEYKEILNPASIHQGTKK